MMWKLIFVLAIFLEGSLAFRDSDCDLEKCRALLPVSLPRIDFSLLSEERLKESCPALLQFIDCFKDELQTCANTNFEELAASDDKTLAPAARILAGSSALVTDLCNEKTQIHKDYIENVECIKRTIENEDNQECVAEASILYSDYLSETSSESNSDCLVGAYVFACASGKVQKECGEVARRTLVDIVKRTKLIQTHICSAEDILELKTDFKEYLQLEAERQSIFEQVFDLRKRK